MLEKIKEYMLFVLLGIFGTFSLILIGIKVTDFYKGSFLTGSLLKNIAKIEKLDSFSKRSMTIFDFIGKDLKDVEFYIKLDDRKFGYIKSKTCEGIIDGGDDLAIDLGMSPGEKEIKLFIAGKNKVLNNDIYYGESIDMYKDKMLLNDGNIITNDQYSELNEYQKGFGNINCYMLGGFSDEKSAKEFSKKYIKNGITKKIRNKSTEEYYIIEQILD